jgi:hypothetical protein
VCVSKNDFLALQAKAGYYDECMEAPLLNQLMDSDLYLLFRFSLDDNTEAVVTATLLALRNLLLNHPDEVKYTVIKTLRKEGSCFRKCKIACTSVPKPIISFSVSIL